VFEDDCSTLDSLHERSDLDSLRVDTTNPRYFSRNDGGCSSDAGRITRRSTTDTRSLVYDPDGTITDFRVEAHHHEAKAGNLVFYASPDEGSSWPELSVSADEYCDVEADWHSAEYTAKMLPSPTDRLRIDLVGGDAPWANQVGHVRLELADEPAHGKRLVDDGSDLAVLAPASDTGELRVDTSNASYFSRNDGNCSTDSTRITRDGTTDTTSLIYAPEGRILDYTIETHSQRFQQGELKLYVSTDAGTTWSRLFPASTEYCNPVGGWRHTELTAASLPPDADQLRLDLAGGEAPWANQVGHVEIEYDPSPTA
jgi:hypothetical protein